MVLLRTHRPDQVLRMGLVLRLGPVLRMFLAYVRQRIHLIIYLVQLQEDLLIIVVREIQKLDHKLTSSSFEQLKILGSSSPSSEMNKDVVVGHTGHY